MKVEANDVTGEERVWLAPGDIVSVMVWRDGEQMIDWDVNITDSAVLVIAEKEDDGE